MLFIPLLKRFKTVEDKKNAITRPIYEGCEYTGTLIIKIALTRIKK